MLESKSIFYAGLKARAKRYAIKVLEAAVILFAWAFTLLLRLAIAFILLLIGIASFFSAIILGSRRTANWVVIIAEILKKYPI